VAGHLAKHLPHRQRKGEIEFDPSVPGCYCLAVNRNLNLLLTNALLPAARQSGSR